jgi:hypothetical protein
MVAFKNYPHILEFRLSLHPGHSPIKTLFPEFVLSYDH